MNLQSIKDVLTFAAFRPEADDSSTSWKKRFAHRKSLLLSISRNSISWAGLGKSCKIIDSGRVQGELKECLTQAAPVWKTYAEDGWCGVSLNSRYVISLETNLSRRKGAEAMLRSNPRSVLGSKYERGKRYAVTHNPETNSSLLLACDEEYIKKVETALKETALQPARICCGSYAMLRGLLSATNGSLPKDQKPDPESGSLYIVCNQGAVCILLQKGEQWTELRSRSDAYEDTPDPVIELIRPFVNQLSPPMTAAFLSDEPKPEFATALQAFLEDIPLTDHTTPSQLWKALSEK